MMVGPRMGVGGNKAWRVWGPRWLTDLPITIVVRMAAPIQATSFNRGCREALVVEAEVVIFVSMDLNNLSRVGAVIGSGGHLDSNKSISS